MPKCIYYYNIKAWDNCLITIISYKIISIRIIFFYMQCNYNFDNNLKIIFNFLLFSFTSIIFRYRTKCKNSTIDYRNFRARVRVLWIIEENGTWIIWWNTTRRITRISRFFTRKKSAGRFHYLITSRGIADIFFTGRCTSKSYRRIPHGVQHRTDCRIAYKRTSRAPFQKIINSSSSSSSSHPPAASRLAVIINFRPRE